MVFKTINDIEGVDKLINNYRNLCGERAIICDVPLNSLKCIAKILTNFKTEVTFLRSRNKDIEYLVKIEKYLYQIENGKGWKGYKRASKYINTVKLVLERIKSFTEGELDQLD